jgi:hypothetical protein
LAEGGQLGHHQWIVALSEVVQAVDEPAEVPVGQLACLAQKTRTAPHAPAGAKSR